MVRILNMEVNNKKSILGDNVTECICSSIITTIPEITYITDIMVNSGGEGLEQTRAR